MLRLNFTPIYIYIYIYVCVCTRTRARYLKKKKELNYAKNKDKMALCPFHPNYLALCLL